MPINLPEVTSGYNLSLINDNFQTIENQWDEKLDRLVSTQANQMEQDLDMNSNKILNHAPTDLEEPTDLVRVDALNQFGDFTGSIPAVASYVGDGTTVAFPKPVNANDARTFQVYVGGLRQEPYADYQIVGETVVFTQAPVLDVSVDIYGYSPTVIENGAPVYADPILANFIGDGTTTNFFVSAQGSGTDSAFISIDGVNQVPNTDFTNAGGAISFTEAPPLNSEIFVRIFAPFTNNATDSFVIADGSTEPRRLGDRFADTLSVKDFGAVGDGIVDDSAAIQAALSSGLKVKAEKGATYRINSSIVITDTEVDLDLNGASFISYSNSGIRFQFYYPYSTALTVTNVNLADRQYTVSDASGLSEGDRVKIASADRALYNRPAPGDGRDYWQAQTFTILAINGNVLTMEQFAEEDYTFATTPVCIPYNKKSCRIYNGTIQSNEGSPATDVNGLLRVFGGSNHRLTDVTCNLSAWTAFGFSGCDNPIVRTCNIRNVGRDDDVQGNHGVDFISCESPMLINSTGGNCRHFVTNNATPTQWADQNYYVLGDSYDMLVHGNISDSDRNNPFDTHHGIRRAEFTNNIARDAASGFGCRGNGVRFINNKIERCGRGIQVWSEATVASQDRTTDIYIGDCRVKRLDERLAETGAGPIISTDLRIQDTGVVTLGENYLSGNVSYGMYTSNCNSLRINGTQYVVSNGDFIQDQSFIRLDSTPVQLNASLRIDVSNMTVNGTNNAVSLTGSSEFRGNGTIDVRTPLVGSLNRIVLHSGSGLFDMQKLTFDGNYSNPIGTGSTDAKIKWQNDNNTSSAFITFTSAPSYDLAFRNSNDPLLTVQMLLAGGSNTLNSIANGKHLGQRLTILASGAGDFTLDNTISNLALSGGNIIMTDTDLFSFLWDGAVWRIEDRKGV